MYVYDVECIVTAGKLGSQRLEHAHAHWHLSYNLLDQCSLHKLLFSKSCRGLLMREMTVTRAFGNVPLGTCQGQDQGVLCSKLEIGGIMYLR